MGELHEKYQQRLAETTNLHGTELTNLGTGFDAAVADNTGVCIPHVFHSVPYPFNFLQKQAFYRSGNGDKLWNFECSGEVGGGGKLWKKQKLRRKPGR